MVSWQPKRKKRINKYHHIHVSTLPFVNLDKMKRIMFFIDTEEYDLETCLKWFEVIQKNMSDIDLCILPSDMINGFTSITGKEYTTLNNILKKMKKVE